MYLVCISLVCATLDCVLGLSCSSAIGYLTARQSAQSLLSPGFPSDYENNQNCRWLISTEDPSKRIQIEVISVNLANWDAGECEDYLEMKDGKEEDSPIFKKWCDSKQLQYKSKGQHILVKFVSDHHMTAPGFALKYYQVDDYKSQCDSSKIRTINIGENPVYLDLPMYTERMDREISCDYHLKSEFNDVAINLEILTFSEIPCEEGSFVIHDGASDDYPVIIDWCYPNQPFQHLTSSSTDLFIRFRLINANTDWMIFRTKVTTKFRSISCSDKSIPNLEVMSTPTYFAYPQHHKSASTRACPLRLWAEKPTQTVRLEVVTKEPPCASKDVKIYDGFDLSSKMIGSLCERTVFSSSIHNLVLSPVNENSWNTGHIFIKASAVEATCNGKTEIRTSFHDKIGEISPAGYPHDLNCNYLLQSDKDSDAIEVNLSGQMVATGLSECEGDFVTLYDGDNLHSPVITTWCGANNQNKRYTSKGSKMMVVITSDSYYSYGSVLLKYYSVPQKGGCSSVTMLNANSTFQYLTSPNYPLYYPIKSYCEYRILAPEDHFVQFEVLHSQMENDCSDIVRVYNGFEVKYDKYLGRWCGDEKPKYTSEGRELLIVFSADNEFTSGGFQAIFYANKGITKNYLISTIIGSLLFAICVIIIIIVMVYVYLQRKKRNQSEATSTPEVKWFIDALLKTKSQVQSQSVTSQSPSIRRGLDFSGAKKTTPACVVHMT